MDKISRSRHLRGVTLPRVQPIIPTWRKEPFDDPEWLFDFKYDGFRGLCYLEQGRCRFISRNGNVLSRFEALGDQVGRLLDVGAPITVLAGVHVGCFELFAHEGIHNITDLKGKTVGLHASPISLLTLMAAEVGLNPAKDIEWVTSADPKVRPLELFADGKIDAFLGFPPEPQELRARRAGHVILNTATDRPWSQYFCCMLAIACGLNR
jgi:hypothetical protein